MATLNTPAELRSYTSLPASILDSVLQTYLDIANIIVTQDLSASGYDAPRLKLIELNLAAHFASMGPGMSGSMSAGTLQLMKIGQSEERYQVLSSKLYGIAKSSYGQIALALDTGGFLGGIASSPLKAQFRLVGDGQGSRRRWGDPWCR